MALSLPPSAEGVLPGHVLEGAIRAGYIDAGRFITHHFALDEIDEAYDVFARAADTGALKVVLSRAS